MLLAHAHEYINIKINHEKEIISFCNGKTTKKDDFINTSQEIIKFSHEIKLLVSRIESAEETEEFKQKLYDSAKEYFAESEKTVFY